MPLGDVNNHLHTRFLPDNFKIFVPLLVYDISVNLPENPHDDLLFFDVFRALLSDFMM